MCDDNPIDIPPDGDPADLLRPEERTPCEVWTRVMGYHRPVTSFNVGKRGEHAERRFFTEGACETRAPATLFV